MPVIVRLLRIAAAYACACMAGFTPIPLPSAAGMLVDQISGAASHIPPDLAGGSRQAILAFLSIIGLGSALIAVWAYAVARFGWLAARPPALRPA